KGIVASRLGQGVHELPRLGIHIRQPELQREFVDGHGSLPCGYRPALFNTQLSTTRRSCLTWFSGPSVRAAFIDGPSMRFRMADRGLYLSLVVCDPSGPWWEVLWNWRWLSSDNLRLVVQGRPVDSKGPAYRRRRQPVADLSSCCGPKKKPRRSGALSLRVPRGSEAVARGDAEQVGVAVEHAHQVRTAGRLGVDVRRVDLDPHVGRVDAQLRRHVPGRAQGVDHALLVGQARGAGRVVGRA